MRSKLITTCRLALRAAAAAAGIALSLPAGADSVGQVQTTKYFAPETLQLLLQRVQANTPGLQVGDVINYIIEFTPVSNGAMIGAGGYITDYVPAGTEVVGAWFVTPNGAGGFNQVSPPATARMANGWGSRGQATYSANWTGLAVDPATVAQCTAAGFTLASCNGRLSEVYADTGIFYSTDPRTSVFVSPDTDGRVRQSTNGYNINPTGSGQLNPIIGQAKATAHNYWDAANINAFGSTQAAITALAAPKATNGWVQTAGGAQGVGTSPFNAGSAVAGPDAGYKLDYTGSVGPWRRISYPGSTIGSTASGPANALGTGAADVAGGSPTAAGWALSTGNPLPAGTNAVRWAAGRLSVGTISYVKIALRLTAPIPALGLINNSEVFGGDASPEDPGTGDRESVWRYTVPSVADNNSNLLVLKQIVCVFSGANCLPIGGTQVPANAKIRYRITYMNSGNATQNNVVLTDTLPAQATAAGNLYVASGPDLRNGETPALSSNSAAVGATRGADAALTAVAASTVITFPTVVSLGPGLGGAIEMDVQTTAAVGAVVTNKAKLASTQVPSGVTASANALVGNTANLVVSKTTTTPSVLPGGTVSYTITIRNIGQAAASAITVSDFLPYSGTTNDATRRFNWASNTSFSGLTAVNPTTSVPPTIAPWSANPNQQQVSWALGAQTIAAGASASITFTANVGANVPASDTTYNNDLRIDYNDSTQAINTQLNDGAPVTVTSPLQVAKTIDCIYNGATCNAYTGSQAVPVNGKLRYKLSYANTGASPHSNVYLCDQLPTQVAGFASVTTPATAPNPAGPYTDSPALAARASPAAAACGFSAGGTTFSYAIGSLPAAATGTVYFDVQTTGAAGNILTNTGRIVSTQAPGGASSQVSVAVRNEAVLTVSKTASSPSTVPGGTVDYTITVTNSGNAAASTMTVYDFLPYTGTTANAATRFSYVSTLSTTGLTAVVPATSVPPTIAPYSNNANQQQVAWTFSGQTLAAGASASITFRAQAGASLAPGSTVYTNDVQVSYNSGSGTSIAATLGAAPVTLPSSLSISKSIDCVYNAAGTACLPYNGSGYIPTAAKLRYRIDAANTGSAAQTNVYLCDQLPTQTTAFGSVTTATVPDNPPMGARTSPANAACGFAGGITFSYPVIASLPAGASRTVYYDLQVNSAANASVTNTAKIVSTQDSGGEVSAVTSTALNVPDVQVAKTTTTPTVVPGGTASYVIAVTNTGSAPTTSLRVYDFLPFSGNVSSTSLRMTYGASTSIQASQTATVAITASSPPSISPYSGNPNQQQVLWDFGNYALQAGATVTITFTATAGASMPSGSYGNSAEADFTGATGPGTNSVNNTASVVVASPPSIAKAFAAPKASVVNAGTTLTFTLTNPNTLALTGGAFTDDFPAGMVLGATSVGGTCAGSILRSRASTGATPFAGPALNDVSVQLSGITVPASGTCTVAITVSGTSAGNKANTSSVLSSANLGSSAAGGSDTLAVYALPTLSKSFASASMPGAGSTTVTISIANPAGNPGAITGIGLSDLLPTSPGAMKVYGTATSVSGCTGATLDGRTGAGAYGAVAAGQTEVRLGGLSLNVGSTCTFTVQVTASSPGSYTNATGAVTATGPVAMTGGSATAVLSVAGPQLTHTKTVSVLSDPVNGTTNPKAIPGAEALYTIQVTNQGAGAVDAGSLVITDAIPTNTELFVGNLGAPSGPIGFSASTAPPAGVTWTYDGSASDDVDFSSDNGATWGYNPSPNGQGYDPGVNAIRLNPKGALAGSAAAPYPQFQLQFKVRIK